MAKVKPRKLKVISVCSKCGEPVCATKNDNAYRHGFPRFKKKRSRAIRRQSFISFSKEFSQEDGIACDGSGKPVVYRRA